VTTAGSQIVPAVRSLRRGHDRVVRLLDFPFFGQKITAIAKFFARRSAPACNLRVAGQPGKAFSVFEFAERASRATLSRAGRPGLRQCKLYVAIAVGNHGYAFGSIAARVQREFELV
jgi:hypothetical protein